MNNGEPQALALVEEKPQQSLLPVMNIAEAKRRWDAIREFVSQIMIEGEDYGVIPGTGSRPTLLKPGAEKLCAFFGLAPDFNVVQREEVWEEREPFFFYEIKCTLHASDGRLRGSGLGSCSSRESRYRGRKVAADIVNTVLKMAKKRALVDAVLSTVGASQFYTQDIEDTMQQQPKPALTELQKIQAKMTDKDSIGRALQALLTELVARDGEEKAYNAFAEILKGHNVTEWQQLGSLGKARTVARQLYDLIHQEPLLEEQPF